MSPLPRGPADARARSRSARTSGSRRPSRSATTSRSRPSSRTPTCCGRARRCASPASTSARSCSSGRYKNTNLSVLTLRINDNGRPIHRDATLKVRPRLFLEGNFYVDLKPGTPSAGTLDDRGIIPVTQTGTPVQLDQVLTALQSDTRGSLQQALERPRRRVQREAHRRRGRCAEPGGARAQRRSRRSTRPWRRARGRCATPRRSPARCSVPSPTTSPRRSAAWRGP